MRRRKARDRDEAQASLDAVTQPHENSNQVNEPAVPSMPDLDALTEAEEIIRQGEDAAPTVKDEAPLRSFDMPSMHAQKAATPGTSPALFHALGKLYPNPPIPNEYRGLVLHIAVLTDHTGCPTFLI